MALFIVNLDIQSRSVVQLKEISIIIDLDIYEGLYCNCSSCHFCL